MLIALLVIASAAPLAAADPAPVVGPTVSLGNGAEVEQATDGAYVYDAWMGSAGGIEFARSTDGGHDFGAASYLPLSEASSSWDPSVAVAPDGTVYVAYMTPYRPVVVASSDHGATFPQVAELTPPTNTSYGDRPFIAAGDDGVVYVTWDYAPDYGPVQFVCGPSCAFTNGDLNGVIQKSSDGGRTWGPITPLGPGFPAQGAFSAPLLVEPSGRIDVLMWGHTITGPTYVVGPGNEFFTSSSDGGQTWSSPVEIDPAVGDIAVPTWWIDGSIGRDSNGDLYATWDTQAADGTDTGWLAYSTDGGQTWSPAQQATAANASLVHIVQVVGGTADTAYVGWLDASDPAGFAPYLRTFRIGQGWLSAPTQVSSAAGLAWTGDTFGLSTPRPGKLAFSWGSGNVISYETVTP